MSFSVFVCVIGASMLLRPESRGMGAIYTALGGISVVRSWTTSSIVVGTLGVSTRSILRTRYFPFRELSAVAVDVGPVGVVGHQREYLRLCRKDGREFVFKEFNCAQSDPGRPSVVRRAAARLSDRLAASEPDPSEQPPCRRRQT